MPPFLIRLGTKSSSTPPATSRRSLEGYSVRRWQKTLTFRSYSATTVISFWDARDPATSDSREDGDGLLVEAKLPQNHLGEYARSLIESGDIKGMSYGMSLNPKQDTVISRAGGVVTRTIANIHDLLDVSLTWEPAYQATTVELRSHGFVASSLQEVLSGTETQIEERGSDESPDEGEPELGGG